MLGVKDQTMRALEFAQQLVAFDSVSRKSNIDVSDYVSNVLKQLQFDVERLEYTDDQGVRKEIGRAHV